MRHRFLYYTLLPLVIALAAFIVSCACNPAPGVQWYRTFDGGSGNSVQQTIDGGYIVCGDIRSYGTGGNDILLIKTDADGNKLWNKVFGDKKDDVGNSVQQTIDGGYIICGTTGARFGTGDADVWLIKTDANGDKLWGKKFGGGGFDAGNSVQQTTDGGYIICGTRGSYNNSYVWLIKTDADGNKIWDETFVDSGYDAGNSVQQTADGGYIICGTTGFLYNADVWLIKTDVDGNKIWDETFGGGGLDGGHSVQQTTDGGYAVCGYTQPYGDTDTDIWLIKTDADGNKIWDKTYDFRRSDYGYSVQQTTDGGYIICGYIISRWQAEFSISKLLLIKTDTEGNKQWCKAFGSAIGDNHGFSARQTTDGGYIVCGYEYTLGPSKVLLLKIAPE